MFHFYDIIILTETWLTPDISDSELGFAGFQVIRLDRNHNNSTSTRGGGVLIAIKDTRSFQPISLTVSNVEQVFVLLSLNSGHLLVGGVYLPPRSPLSVVESHTTSVEHIISSYKPNSLVICGDYNLPNINWSSDELGLIGTNDPSIISTTIIDSFSYLNFFQHNFFRNNHSSILDLVFSNCNRITVNLATEYLVIPDPYHPPLHVVLPSQSDKSVVNTHTYKDFKAANYPAITQFINSFNWELTFSQYTIEDAASVFNEALLHAIDLFVPTKIFKLPKFPAWTSPSLKNLILEKKRSHALYKCSRSPYDYSAFSELRAKCKRQSKIDYLSYIKNTENSLNRNPSLFWKSIKNLNQKNTIPATLFWNNDKVDTPLGSANLFSKYFYSMYNNSIYPPVNISNINTIPY
ncbi:uncharacterized protein LOC132949850 [Metopolophium dirhodum]|uniref:uncharacterized protein LOC132949850 n=1 Tax=Metopolophium dirhodum TaxID=44670 RepID=UPI00298FD52C|nr:uncharacterized protein LOC132949850 [Metopolophium dirhodum]